MYYQSRVQVVEGPVSLLVSHGTDLSLVAASPADRGPATLVRRLPR